MLALELFFGILGLVISFGFVITLVIKHVNYGLALTLGAIILGLFFGSSIVGLFETAYMTLTEMTTLELILAVALIPILAQSLIDTKLIDGLIQGLKSKLPRKGVMAMIPAVFGLFPMMGGALISAPLINEEADKLQVNAEKKTIINLWFRHIWFFVSPLVTTLIIVSRLTNVNLYNIILLNLPVFIIHTTVGYFFLIRPIKNNNHSESNINILPIIVKGSLPIALTIIVNIIGVPLSISLLIGIASAFLIGKKTLKNSIKTIKTGFKWNLVAAVLGAMYFRYTIKSVGVDNFIISNAKLYGVPIIAFFTIIPLIFGFITADPQTSAIMSASLVANAFDSLLPAQVSLLYISCFLAYFLSPLHLCMILTVGYFKSKLKGVYKWLIPFILLDYAVCLITEFAVLGLTGI